MAQPLHDDSDAAMDVMDVQEIVGAQPVHDDGDRVTLLKNTQIYRK